jgi:hypothetical protein
MIFIQAIADASPARSLAPLPFTILCATGYAGYASVNS